jgi:hypothetical protein
MHLINLSEEAVGQIQMDSTSTEQVWVEFIPDDAPKQLERGLRMVGMKKCGE